MKRTKIVIGLHTSMEFLEETKNDKSLTVFAFEPNKDLVSKIYNEFEIPQNYVIIDKAVSNINGKVPFYICSLDSCSSLMNWGNGPKLGEMRKVEVECIRMDNFIKDYEIENIEFVIIDTQGNDLNVLDGFGEKFEIVEKGTCESLSKETNWKLYENQPPFLDFVKFFKKNNYSISWDWNWGGAIQFNEINIKFEKSKKLSKLI
jgi:FkbM family methyltransferase